VLALGLFTLNSRVNLPAFALGTVTGASVAEPGGLAATTVSDCPCHRKRSP
jgi:hypothetical protein